MTSMNRNKKNPLTDHINVLVLDYAYLSFIPLEDNEKGRKNTQDWCVFNTAWSSVSTNYISHFFRIIVDNSLFC